MQGDNRAQETQHSADIIWLITCLAMAWRGKQAGHNYPDSKDHGAYMGPIWGRGRQDPGGPHVGPMNFAIWIGLLLPKLVFNRRENKKYYKFAQSWVIIDAFLHSTSVLSFHIDVVLTLSIDLYLT